MLADRRASEEEIQEIKRIPRASSRKTVIYIYVHRYVHINKEVYIYILAEKEKDANRKAYPRSSGSLHSAGQVFTIETLWFSEQFPFQIKSTREARPIHETSVQRETKNSNS